MALIIVAVVLISTGICHYVAKRKGFNVRWWIVAGALFGPLAIPFVLLIPGRETTP